MRIPKKFKLFGMDWKVSYATPAFPEKPTAWAVTKQKEQTITIDASLPQQMKEQTFVHELLHVIYFHMGIDQAAGLSPDKEEIIVNSLANGLYNAIQCKVLNV